MLEVNLKLPAGESVVVVLTPTKTPIDASMQDNTLVYHIADAAPAYLLSKATGGFASPPDDRRLALTPETDYSLCGRATVEGGQAALWVIEYDAEERLCHHVQRLRTGSFDLRWTPHAEHKAFCLAVRLGGDGTLELSDLELSNTTQRRRAGVEPSGARDLKPVDLERAGDAQMHMELCRESDKPAQDDGVSAFAATLSKHDIGRSLVIPHGSDRMRDSYDQICELAADATHQVFPFLWFRSDDRNDETYSAFQLHQLELLWQVGRLFGVMVDKCQQQSPTDLVLDWMDRRGLLTMWNVTSEAELTWLEENVLSRCGFPVLLSHVGDSPLDRKTCAASVAMMDRHPQLYLVTSAASCESLLSEAVSKHADRVLLGSGFPAMDSMAAREAVSRLECTDEAKALVLSENLRFLTERVRSHRAAALAETHDLMFPPVPRSASDLAAQGFEIVPADALPCEEVDEAKTTWRDWEIKSWYQQDKPWARLLVDLVSDLKPKSILEFGCNVGRNLMTISRAMPDVRLVGLDINEEAIRLGRENTGLDLRVGDERTLATFAEGEFDLVFTVSVLDHIPVIEDVCQKLVRCAARNVFCLEVTLPVEGKVLKHFDHKRAAVVPSTEASYSWEVDKYMADHPRAWRMDKRPCYLHSASLGPYYWSYLVFLDPA